jgi:hypothetical protein
MLSPCTRHNTQFGKTTGCSCNPGFTGQACASRVVNLTHLVVGDSGGVAGGSGGGGGGGSGEIMSDPPSRVVSIKALPPRSWTHYWLPVSGWWLGMEAS